MAASVHNAVANSHTRLAALDVGCEPIGHSGNTDPATSAFDFQAQPLYLTSTEPPCTRVWLQQLEFQLTRVGDELRGCKCANDYLAVDTLKDAAGLEAVFRSDGPRMDTVNDDSPTGFLQLEAKLLEGGFCETEMLRR